MKNTGYQYQGVDEFSRWVEDLNAKVGECLENNSKARISLEDLLDAACRECSAQEADKLNTSGLDRFTHERNIDPSELQAKANDLEKSFDSVLSRACAICHAIKLTTDKRVEIIPNASLSIQKLLEQINIFRDGLNEAGREMKRLNARFEETEFERKRLADLRDKVSNSGISSDFDLERQKLLDLADKLEGCQALLHNHKQKVVEMRGRQDTQVDSKVKKRQEAIERIQNSTNCYERLGLAQPRSRIYDNYTKADISKAFREQSKLVHPDKCKLPGAEQASRLLSAAKIELLERYRYRL